MCRWDWLIISIIRNDVFVFVTDCNIFSFEILWNDVLAPKLVQRLIHEFFGAIRSHLELLSHWQSSEVKTWLRTLREKAFSWLTVYRTKGPPLGIDYHSWSISRMGYPDRKEKHPSQQGHQEWKPFLQIETLGVTFVTPFRDDRRGHLKFMVSKVVISTHGLVSSFTGPLSAKS